MQDKKRGEIIIYQGRHRDIQIKVTLENETIWMSQAEMSRLFGIERSVITKHLRNIFHTHELIEKSNVQKMHIATSDKSVNFTVLMRFFLLDIEQIQSELRNSVYGRRVFCGIIF